MKFAGPMILALSLWLSPAMQANEKGTKREWQTATVKSAEQKDASGFTFQFVGPLGYKTKVAWLYTLETETIVYELLWPAEMPLHVTINGEVKLAKGKDSAYYILDDNGKERRLTIYKKTAKPKKDTVEPAKLAAEFLEGMG